MSGSVLLDLSPEKPVAVHFAHAAFILNLRARCAGYRTTVVASDDRRCLDLSRCHPPGRTRTVRTRGCPRPVDFTWRAAACGAVDANRGGTGGADHSLGVGFAPGIPASMGVDYDHRGRSRIARTGRVVC